MFHENSLRTTSVFIAPYVFKANYVISDCLPKNPNLKLSCSIDGTTLSSAFGKFMEHIASKVYCRDCGKLCNDKDYILEEEQCMACIFETILLKGKQPPIFCSICQTETCKFITLQCNHTFHRKCVSKLFRNACPLCSKQIFTV